MHDERSHPLLQQTPLSVNPFIDLPKAPTLPHNYASLPSTLPPSSINAPPLSSNLELPAYVTSSSGFATHPSTIINQSKALLASLEGQRKEAEEKIHKWEEGIRERELAEKRRKAPGWLDRAEKILEPERKEEIAATNLIDESALVQSQPRRASAEDLGAAMDKAFGRSELR